MFFFFVKLFSYLFLQVQNTEVQRAEGFTIPPISKANFEKYFFINYLTNFINVRFYLSKSRTLKVRKPSPEAEVRKPNSGSRIQNTEHAALDFISKVRNSISRRTTKSGIPFRGGPLSPELFRGGPVFRRSGTL
ncbi:hypothetical protein RCL_jg28511.t3 [Rhizophagus clarus]|uniref:Secreted protein n=1 Tax=Rhizophagus clarus TaxID=94130 RepID=A0A8H3QGF2_9GLOM|nr:hypothetical protein RCL_jg28511.t3 [Rhizophagus clarus]